MLKVYSINSNNRKLIEPNNNIYDVVEGFDYILEYHADEISDPHIFIEDIPIPKNDFEFRTNTKIKTIQKKFFIDYFGYACLRINNEEFIFNIKVEKFKLGEIEDIFTFLWDKEENLFSNFFSKSTKKIKFDRLGNDLNNTSKYILFATYFLETFEAMYLAFSNQPHMKLVEAKTEKDIANSSITQYSIDWVFRHLDTLCFSNYQTDSSYGFKINGKAATIHKIGVEDKINSFITYENSIILGALSYLNKEIIRLRKGIASIINVDTLQSKEYADFSDLKKIPFLKMYQESTSLEKRCLKLSNKYKRLFVNVPLKIEKPQLTPVFSSKIHYQKAYKLIRNLFNYRFILNGEFRLLNITKLSQLYEIYNFHILIDSIKEVLNDTSFEIQIKTNREDKLSNIASFIHNNYTINLYYENIVSSGEKIDLIRIDKRKCSYYKPDYILEIIQNPKHSINYWIFDSKYSKQSTVRNHHLSECIFKYLLNIGLKDESSKKIDGLALLYPAGKSESYLKSTYYKPTIDMIVSKPKNEFDLLNFINKIIKEKIPHELINHKYC